MSQNPLEMYFSGLVGGVAGIVVGQPLDTIKVRLQTQSGYSGTISCYRAIIQKEGYKALFKGMSSPLIGVSMINAVVFGVQAQTVQYFKEETLITHFLSGFYAGAVQSFVASPLELAKTQLQVQGINVSQSAKQRRYKNTPDALYQICRQDGVRGVSRGLLLTLVRDAPAFGIYFSSYAYLTQTLFPVKEDGMMTIKDFSNSLMAGGVAGVNSWAFTYPIDVVKSCMQADKMGAGEKGHKYHGTIDCCRQLWRKEGIKPFVRGMNACLCRAFPVNGATFAGVQLCDRIISEMRKSR